MATVQQAMGNGRRICRLNGTFEFPFDAFGERLNFDETEQRFISELHFQTVLDYDPSAFTDNFINNFKTQDITSIEIIIPEDNNRVCVLSDRFNFLDEVHVDYPPLEYGDQENRGHVRILSK